MCQDGPHLWSVAHAQMWQHTGRRFAWVVVLLALSLTGGCCLAPRGRIARIPLPGTEECSSRETVADLLVWAGELERADDARCVDVYFRACAQAWKSVSESSDGTPVVDTNIYNSAVESLLRMAPHFGRLSPEGLIIHQGERTLHVPIVHQGFVWKASDFQRLHSAPTKREPFLTRRYACDGVGSPVVVERCRNDGDPMEARFFPERTYFAATAVLRFDTTTVSSSQLKGPVLEFHNPAVARSLSWGDNRLPLASDLSAPLARMLEDAPRAYLAGFIDPGGPSASTRLQMLEPYQSGKVPLVLIHGLYSDPLSWADLVNDLRATPGFDKNYQIWLYRYPTGQGFLQTAAVLRNELQAAIAQCDPARRDTALRRTVLVGHSMGGLIAKLQVTRSDDLIWKRLANRPLDEIVTTESTRGLLAETCYFEPSSDVSRVIFIASPHSGSLCSSALIGRGASLLVRPQPEQQAMHRQLIRDNPDTFIPEFEGRFPTSVDMLVPQSPLLETMRQMRIEPTVKVHNIIGVSHRVSLDGPSDGIVSARSASHPYCESVLLVDSSHAQVHRAQETSAEILRILAEHCRRHDGVRRGQTMRVEPACRLAPIPRG